MPKEGLRCYKRRPLVLSFHILTMAKRDNLEFENSDNDDFQETFGTAILGQQEAASPRLEYSSSENFDYSSTIISEEQEYAATDPEERDNVTTIVNNSEKAIDDELALIENAFEYLIKKKYPPGCIKNHKRIIRRKAERLEERNGEIFYKKRGGSMVSSYITTKV